MLINWVLYWIITATALIWRTGLTNRYGRRSNRLHLGSSTNLTCFTFYIAFPLDWRLNPNWIAFVLDSVWIKTSNCCWISFFLARPSIMERIKLKCETLNSLSVCLGAKKICNFDKWAPDGAGAGGYGRTWLQIRVVKSHKKRGNVCHAFTSNLENKICISGQ